MKSIALLKRKHRDEAIEDFHLDELTIPAALQATILASDILSVKHMLHRREVSVHQLVTLYIKRCIEYALPLELLADVNFKEAVHTAKLAIPTMM
jgi:hypothetical protein